jgi:hypothetical protein
MKRMLSITAVLTLWVVSPAAGDIIWWYDIPLEASQVVPPTDPAGTGSCTVSLNETAGTVDVSCFYDSMTSNVTAAHIHGPAAVGSNAGIVVGLTQTGGTSGTIDGTDLALTAQQVADLKNGLHYVNVHTTGNPGGEIRGQIVGGAVLPIPTVSEWGLIALAALLIGAAAMVMRKRRLA